MEKFHIGEHKGKLISECTDLTFLIWYRGFSINHKHLYEATKKRIEQIRRGK